MIKVDEDALICDLAETYQIYDYKQLPPTRVAVFACGLRDDSRIKMKLNNQNVPTKILLLAGISDRLGRLVWFQTKDGQEGNNPPVSLVNLLINGSDEKDDVVIFDSGEDFNNVRKRLIGGE